MPAGPRPAPLAVAAALLMSLTACAGGDAADPDATPAAEAEESLAASPSSPSPSVGEAVDEAAAPDADDSTGDGTGGSTTQEVLPPPEPPRFADTPAARKAFAEFVVERWGYALATNDAEAVGDLSAKAGPCKGCGDLARELRTRRKEGWNVDFPGAEVTKVTVEPAGPPRTFDAVATIDIPASRSYFSDGSFRNENKAFRDAEFAVQMRREKGRYVLLSYSLT